MATSLYNDEVMICKEQIRCSKCNNTNHNTLMHNENVRNPQTPKSQGGEPLLQETIVQSACMDICKGEFTRK